jgi:flagellar protein FlgJ
MSKTTNFVKKFYPYAKEAQIKSGIALEYILARQVLETGWGEHCPGNNAFGVKANASWKGKKQLLITREEFADDKQGYRFPEVLRIVKLENGKFQYIVKDYFRVYDSITDSYIDHCNFYFENSRYAEALNYRHDAKKFNEMVNKAGYSTGSNVITLINSIIETISTI